MNSTARIFKDRMIKKRLERFTRESVSDYDAKYKEICLWCKATTESDLAKTKETAVQGAFMTRLFNQVFGYLEIMDDTDCYHQERETKTVLDSTESDGALGFFYKDAGKKDVRVVIELKDARTPLDKKQNRSSHLTPVEQAFNYANKNGAKCGWVIVSNFVETRLYKSTSSLEYETFDMRKMSDEKEFLRFYYFMCKDHLIAETGKSLIDELYQENELEGVDITNQFYRTYKEIRNSLFLSLKENNSDKDDLLLFAKSQKLMDRFTFICFCEDCDLLPQNTFSKLVETAKNSFSVSPTKLWDQLRGLFIAIDQGNPPMNINRYNGGLFKADPELDSLTIPDEVLESFSQLSNYDFNSDLNVNILGQIFEQSISDVEQIKNEIKGEESEGVGKQKEDGIYYTPYYVTRYIVEQTVGVWLSQKKEDLKSSIFQNGAFKAEVLKSSTRRMNTIEISQWQEIPDYNPEASEEEAMFREAVTKLHIEYWKKYEEALKQIKICDPACGSGAFLNQCYDFLYEEMRFVRDMQFELGYAQTTLFDVNKQILQNNLFGVDINAESVEITKLSLWLKTAKNDQTLASLDDNIKCGNSIVADRTVVDNAFVWQEEFPEVFANGGFDIVVGNPPYGAKLSQTEKDYLLDHYLTTEYNYDTYKTFFELGMNITKSGGFLGYITPNTFFTLEMGANKLRQFLFNYTILKIVEVFNVFPSAVVEPVITVFRKERSNENESFTSICLPRKAKLSSTFLNEGIEAEFIQSDLRKNEKLIFNYRSSKSDQQICEDMGKFPRLDTLFDVMTGAKPYQVGKGVPAQTKEIVDSKPFTGTIKIDDTWVPYFRGRGIDRFASLWDLKREYIKYGEWLAEPRTPDVFFGEKLFVRQTGDSLVATYDVGNVSNNTLHSIYPLASNTYLSLLYLLGIINSSLMNWYYKTVHYLEVGKPMAEVKGIFIKSLPIAVGDDDQRERISKIVDELLSLSSQRTEVRVRYIQYLEHVYEPHKVTERIESFEKSTYKEFCAELKKQKVKLSAAEQMELLPLFMKHVEEINALSSTIQALYSQLDEEVFSIYGIDPELSSRIKDQAAIII